MACLPHAVLVVDLNDNGRFDHRREMLTNHFTREGLPAPNAAVALLDYDHPNLGGNGDALLSNRDYYWNHLYLWDNRNQDAVSTAGEMTPLDELGIEAIDPFPRLIKREGRQLYRINMTDRWGNRIAAWLY
jgi:hypothetical protein